MENEKKKKDRRVIKTQRAIRNAFVKLMTEKDIDRITIKEIADEADVDRKTIYNYYGGIHEIREELENELARVFERETAHLRYGLNDPQASFEALVKILNNNLDLYGQLMKLDYNSRLLMKIMEYFKMKVQAAIELGENVSPQKSELAALFVTTGMFNAYRYWFNSDRKQPLEEFSQEVSCLILEGLPAYLSE